MINNTFNNVDDIENYVKNYVSQIFLEMAKSESKISGLVNKEMYDREKRKENFQLKLRKLGNNLLVTELSSPEPSAKIKSIALTKV